MYQRRTFIDSIYIDNYVVKYLSYLHTFIFDFVTDHVNLNEQVLRSFEEIRRTFIERGLNVNGYIDFKKEISNVMSRCHVYSIPSTMEYIQLISYSFPGGTFMNVRVLYMRDIYGPFEHSLFVKIACSFPLLHRLGIQSRFEQKDKLKKVSSIIEFSNLIELDCRCTHVDYVEQFLSDSNTHLPSLSKLVIQYEHLLTITENFTRNATRINCAKAKSMKLYEEITIVHSKDFYLYFALI